MPAPLIEFPADDPDRARRFWRGVLGVTLAPRPAAAGSGWQTDADGLRLGVHERGPGPGDTASLPYFTVADLATTLERVRDSAARSSTPAIGGLCAGTPRAARSRWPPRLHPGSSTATGRSTRSSRHAWWRPSSRNGPTSRSRPRTWRAGTIAPSASAPSFRSGCRVTAPTSRRWTRSTGGFRAWRQGCPSRSRDRSLGASPGDGYPFPWSVYGWIEGENAAVDRIDDLTAFAEDLAGFLRALQTIDATGGPPPGPHNFFRGGPLATYDQETRTALAAVRGRIAGDTASAVGKRRSLPPGGAPRSGCTEMSPQQPACQARATSSGDRLRLPRRWRSRLRHDDCVDAARRAE